MPNKNRMTVYYDAIRSEDNDGFEIVVTEKGYWDRNHFVDDGASGIHVYDVIDNAMSKYGAEEASTSEYKIYDDEGQTINSLIAFMAKQGIDLVKDPAFSAWVNRI